MKAISIMVRTMSKIKEFIKENLRYILFLLLVGLVGGIFTGIYTLEITDPTLIEEAIAQLEEAVDLLKSVVRELRVLNSEE